MLKADNKAGLQPSVTTQSPDKNTVGSDLWTQLNVKK